MASEPDRSTEMIIKEGDPIQLAVFVLERFANGEGPFTPGDALRVAATIRTMREEMEEEQIFGNDFVNARNLMDLWYGKKRDG